MFYILHICRLPWRIHQLNCQSLSTAFNAYVSWIPGSLLVGTEDICVYEVVLPLIQNI